MLLLLLPYNLNLTINEISENLAIEHDFNIDSFYKDEIKTVVIPCPVNYLAYILSKDDDVDRCINLYAESLSKLSDYKLKNNDKKIYIFDKAENTHDIPQGLFSSIVEFENNISPIYKMLAEYILDNHNFCKEVLHVLYENIKKSDFNKYKEKNVYKKVQEVKDALFNIRKDYKEKEYIFSELKKMIDKDCSFTDINNKVNELKNEKKQLIDLFHYTEESLEKSLKEKSSLSDLLVRTTREKKVLEEKIIVTNNERATSLKRLAKYTSKLFSESKSFRKEIKLQEEILKKSDIFDPKFYLKNYPDLECFNGSLELHYLLYGADEGRNPSNLFVTNFYLNEYEDVRESALNPLVHYIKYGLLENRKAF